MFGPDQFLQDLGGTPPMAGRAGEDVAVGDRVLRAGDVLTPAQLSLAAALGHSPADKRRQCQSTDQQQVIERDGKRTEGQGQH